MHQKATKIHTGTMIYKLNSCRNKCMENTQNNNNELHAQRENKKQTPPKSTNYEPNLPIRPSIQQI